MELREIDTLTVDTAKPMKLYEITYEGEEYELTKMEHDEFKFMIDNEKDLEKTVQKY